MTGGHFSVYRAAFAVWLGVHLGSRALGDVVLADRVVFGASALVALALALGLRSRTMAMLLSVALAYASSDFGALVLTLVPLALITALPVAPYLSMDARGRPDPGGGFEIPEGTIRGVVGLGAGAALLVSWDERAITGDPLVPAWTAAAAFFTALGWARGTRSLGVLALAAATVARMALRPEDVWAVPLLFVVVLAFDSGFVPPLRVDGADRVFYDGGCGLCHRAVRFALAEDRVGTALRYAPLESDAFVATVPEEKRAELPDSIVVATPDGRILVRSLAIIRIAERVGGIWRIGGALLRVVPRALLDAVYDRIAAIRHRLFKKPSDVCPIVPKELRARFDY